MKKTNNIIFGDLVHFASNFRVAFFLEEEEEYWLGEEGVGSVKVNVHTHIINVQERRKGNIIGKS